MTIADLLIAAFALASVASASSYHLRHVVPSYFKLRARGQGGSPCIPRIKQSIAGVTVLLALWVMAAGFTLVLRLSADWIYIYSWALRIYSRNLVALVSRFALPAVLLAQIELTTALRYPSDYIKGDEKKGANRNWIHRASLLAFRSLPLLAVVRLITWFVGMFEHPTVLRLSFLIELGSALLLFILAMASLLNYMTAKDRTLREAPQSLTYIHALTVIRHLYDLALNGAYLRNYLKNLMDTEGLYGDALGSVFITWTAVISIYLIYQVFSVEVDNFWDERPAYLGREALKEKTWRS